MVGWCGGRVVYLEVGVWFMAAAAEERERESAIASASKARIERESVRESTRDQTWANLVLIMILHHHHHHRFNLI